LAGTDVADIAMRAGTRTRPLKCGKGGKVVPAIDAVFTLTVN